MGRAALKKDTALVAGLLANDGEILATAVRELETHWGPLGLASAVFDFDFTDYYEKEFGPRLRRQFVAFAEKFPPEALRGAKIWCNELEERFSRAGRRSVNIDPGYLDLGTVVLASTKDATYRVYLGDGIYAQPMLYYEKGTFHPWPWTYPDYRTREAVLFFNQVRREHRARGRPGGVIPVDTPHTH